jgi:ABC-2 type transport system ATP-binding protein
MISNTKVIEVENLVKRFGDFIANDNLTFDVYQGEVFGFLGANGAGKTTAMRILCGLSRPTSGKILVAGWDAATHPEDIKKNIGYMSQKFSLYEDMTVKENIRFYGGIYGLSRNDVKSKITEMIEKVGIGGLENKLISELPIGWKQKLAFAVAIFHDPKIVFLDEPTGGVDPFTRRQFWNMIYDAAKSGITVFVTTHYMDEAEYCDRVSIMDEGKIVALDTPENLKKMYGVSTMNDVFIKIVRPELI